MQGAGQQAWVWSRRHRLEQGLGLSWATGARTWSDRSSLPPCCYFLACYGEATNYHHHGVVRLMFILGRKS
jgi:hypothetical protein